MNRDREKFAPPEYDKERLGRFLRRATDSRNIPVELRPEKGFPKDAYADAIIGLYIADSERAAGVFLEGEPLNGNGKKHETHRRNLARVALTVDYLRGVEPHELRDSGEDQERIKKEGVVSYALEVASRGARGAAALLDTDTAIDELEDPTSELFGLPAMEIIDSHRDLDDVIKRLYQNHRMSNRQAQSLLLLFELQQSHASPEARLAALLRSRKELYMKVRGAMLDETLCKNGQFIDPRVQVGAQYVRMIAGTPRQQSSAVKLGGVVDTVMVRYDDFTSREDATDHVRSYIGHTLETLYPRK